MARVPSFLLRRDGCLSQVVNVVVNDGVPQVVNGCAFCEHVQLNRRAASLMQKPSSCLLYIHALLIGRAFQFVFFGFG